MTTEPWVAYVAKSSVGREHKVQIKWGKRVADLGGVGGIVEERSYDAHDAEPQ